MAAVAPTNIDLILNDKEALEVLSIAWLSFYKFAWFSTQILPCVLKTLPHETVTNLA
jgi:hypothetical protein